MRSTTFSTWRMLTLGAEYGTWALSPESLGPRNVIVNETSDEMDSCVDVETESTIPSHEYDTVVQLDPATDARESGSKRSIIHTHESHTISPWSNR